MKWTTNQYYNHVYYDEKSGRIYGYASHGYQCWEASLDDGRSLGRYTTEAQAKKAVEEAVSDKAKTNPTDASTWPRVWRADRHIWEVICPHGVGHPERETLPPDDDGTHGCDGCCKLIYPKDAGESKQ